MGIWTAVLTILAIGLFLYFFRRKNIFEQLEIPHDSPVPILGNMGPCLLGKMNVIDLMQSMYDRHAETKYFGLYDFQTPIVVIRDPEIIKSIAIKNFENFPDHRGFTDADRDPLFGKSLFSLKGNDWREMRAILSPSFTSSKMKMMFHLITECTVNFTNVVLERSKNEDYEANIKDIFTRITADVISSCAFGININSMKEPKNELYVMGRESTDFEGILSLKFLLIRNFKLISRLLGVKIVSDSVTRFFTNVISSNIATRREKGITRPDFLQLMMEAQNKNSLSRELTIQEITANAFIFFFGGLDTVSTQLCYIAHEITVNPHVQDRLQKEIDSVLENCKVEPTYNEIINMSYMDAVINETMRLYPGGAILDRVCKNKFELPPPLPGKESITLDPGTNIWIPVFSIQRDPKYYKNPEKFDPERFLGEKKINTNTTTFIPFGIGPRICIGNRFALMEMKIALFHLLSRFNFKVCSKTPIPLKFKKNTFALLPEGGFWLKFESRK